MQSGRHTMLIIRRVVMAIWVVAALWIIRDATADDDTKGLDQDQLEQELEQLGS